ncbi:hypothetical protein GJ496_011445 [Pomphorhynchus laevis]|nr:hypothetical protein GJ496_011445 [Pomphorhynchus laevis]
MRMCTVWSICFNCNARNCLNRDYVQPKPKSETSLDSGTKHQDRINNIDLSTLNARIQNTLNDTSIRTNNSHGDRGWVTTTIYE